MLVLKQFGFRIEISWFCKYSAAWNYWLPRNLEKPKWSWFKKRVQTKVGWRLLFPYFCWFCRDLCFLFSSILAENRLLFRLSYCAVLDHFRLENYTKHFAKNQLCLFLKVCRENLNECRGIIPNYSKKCELWLLLIVFC